MEINNLTLITFSLINIALFVYNLWEVNYPTVCYLIL